MTWLSCTRCSMTCGKTKRVYRITKTIWIKSDALNSKRWATELLPLLLNIFCRFLNFKFFKKSRGRPHTVWCDEDGYVTRLSLTSADFHGSPLLPEALFRLTKLRTLELIAIRNASPSSLDRIGSLTSLVTLTIAHTSALVDSLPASLGKLTRLNELQLAENSLLTGTIPTEIGQLKRLQSLQLFKNNLHGTIRKKKKNQKKALIHCFFCFLSASEIGKLTELLHLCTKERLEYFFIQFFFWQMFFKIN